MKACDICYRFLEFSPVGDDDKDDDEDDHSLDADDESDILDALAACSCVEVLVASFYKQRIRGGR